MTGPTSTPIVVDAAANREFERVAREAGFDPDNRWIGGFVDEVWRRGRHLFQSWGFRLADRRVLEFGCNVGATAIVLALLGARPVAIEPNARYLRVARANAARYGVAGRIDFVQVADTTRLPFPDATFDLVTCAAVLEYVEPQSLAQVQRDIDRVVRPGGIIVVSGTSNRLWPREILSGRWFINYVPRSVDRYLPVSAPRQRGVFPWRVRYGFGQYQNLDRVNRGHAYLMARQHMHPGPLFRLGFAAANAVALACGTSLGLLTPTICVTLKKLDGLDVAI
jgi:SAM-dependent methyltransferase